MVSLSRTQPIDTFDDWVDFFRQWREDIDYDTSLVQDFEFEAKYGDVGAEIEFGDFAGERRWERLIEIPDQRIRDALLTLIVYQGDTEFASVEQQRNLLQTAPSQYDLQSLVRVNAEEMRHGWQMCHILVEHFGDEGKREALKLLERRAWNRERLLGSFNEDIDNWLDFFIFTNFVDRDGKFQLNMLSTSAFTPLAASMGPMLKEERFHMATGNNGMKRIVEAGVVPQDLFQRYLNKWLSTAYDLFGTDHSSSAHWGYVWGIKGRFDEQKLQTQTQVADKSELNEHARRGYMAEVEDILAGLNKVKPDHYEAEFTLPDVKFHRAIGDDAGQPYSVTGELLSPQAYDQHLRETLPTEEDEIYLRDLMKESDWIAPPPKASLW
jgi:benzoyl-CoA 2,3-dioxygenase component B